MRAAFFVVCRDDDCGTGQRPFPTEECRAFAILRRTFAACSLFHAGAGKDRIVLR